MKNQQLQPGDGLWIHIPWLHCFRHPLPRHWGQLTDCMNCHHVCQADFDQESGRMESLLWTLKFQSIGHVSSVCCSTGVKLGAYTPDRSKIPQHLSFLLSEMHSRDQLVWPGHQCHSSHLCLVTQPIRPSPTASALLAWTCTAYVRWEDSEVPSV